MTNHLQVDSPNEPMRRLSPQFYNPKDTSNAPVYPHQYPGRRLELLHSQVMLLSVNLEPANTTTQDLSGTCPSPFAHGLPLSARGAKPLLLKTLLDLRKAFCGSFGRSGKRLGNTTFTCVSECFYSCWSQHPMAVKTKTR